MGLFGKKEIPQESKLRETATINTKYIHSICQMTQDSTEFLINMAKIDEYYIEPAKEAMDLLNKSIDITRKAISALKNYDKKSASLIESYKNQIDELNDRVQNLLKIANEEHENG